MATFIAKFKIGALKNNFLVLPFGISKLTEKLVFMYSSLMTELKKRNCEIFFRTKFSFAFKSVNNIFEKKGNRFIRLWTIPGLFYSAQLVKHFSFFFITDKDYGYLLSWGLGFILWCSSFSEWVFPYTCQLLIGFGKFFPSPVLKKRLYSSLVTHPVAAHSSSRSPYHETTRSMTTPPWMMC